MAITFSERSKKNMEGLHPDLVRVLNRAAAIALNDEDFMVLEGVRSKEQMWINYGKGRNANECNAKGVPAKYAQPGVPKVTWLANPLKSNHRVWADGYGHAMDIVPFPVDWNNLKPFKNLYTLIMQAATIEKVTLRSGWDWDQDGKTGEQGETDLPHYELV